MKPYEVEETLSIRSIRSIRDPPSAEPLEMLPLRAGSLHSEANGAEQPEEADDQDIQATKEDPVDILVELAGCPVNAEAGREDGEIQCGVVMVHVRYAAHGYEGEIVQEPTDDGV